MKYLILLLLLACEKPQPPVPLPPPHHPVSVSGVARGFTLDSVENLPLIISKIKELSWRPWVRIVFDYPEKPSAYREAVEQISKVAEIVGQPSDSVYSSKMTVAQYEQRFREYIEAFPQINIWESCNECNGDWAGSDTLAQAEAATRLIKHYGKKAMFTPYWNTPTCADKHGDYYEWAVKNISAYVKAETDYVALSVYGYDCDGPEPTYNKLNSELDRLQLLFPKSIVMVGEYGKQGSMSIARHYLSYPRLGFGGYWFGYQAITKNPKDWEEFKK